MLVYFTGPLFCQAELQFNERMTERIEEIGYDVYLPQRDGVVLTREPWSTMTPEEQSAAIFDIDRRMVLDSDVFVFVLDGRVPDEGACIELGLAYGQKLLQKPNKRLIGLLTDRRAAFPQWELNPMVREPLEHVAHSETELLSVLREWYRPSVSEMQAQAEEA